MESINKPICEKVKELLSIEKEVIAIFNNGSSVVDLESSGSDIDFVIILKDEKDKEKIIKIIRSKLKVIKNKEDPKIVVEEQYDILGKRADFTFRSKQTMDERVNTFYDSKENFLEFQHFIKHKIIDAIAVYDPENLLERWKREIERYPEKIMKEVFNLQISLIKENLFYWKYHEFRNEFQFGFEKWDVIQAICQAIYAKNKTLFMLPYKRLHNDLKILKPNIEKELYALIRDRNTQKTINKKINIVKSIVSKLEKW